MKNLRDIELKFVKGIGPARAKLLDEELSLSTVHDLLRHFPSHYLDRSNVYRIRDFAGEMPAVQLRGQFVTFNVIGEGAKARLVGLFTDGTSNIEIVWFKRIKQLRDLYKTRVDYIVFGKPQEFNGRWSLVHPEVDPVNSSQAQAEFRGVYPLTEKLRNRGVTSRNIFQWAQNALSAYGDSIPEMLPPEILARYHFMGAREAVTTVHNPTDAEKLRRARERLKFEELFYLQLNIRRYSSNRPGALPGIPFPRIGRFFNSFYNEALPFPLTEAQKRVLREIRADLGSGRQMNRLLQGDVGSGKTIVALMTMLIALDNGTQACIMAPTEILATQHYESMRSMAAPLGVNVRLLTGSTGRKERETIARELADGSLHILVGTHAVIEDNVSFKNLGLAVIDEQHRFGVVQRARLWGKNAAAPPHVLVMTATPIPRTLAMTVYGDLDVSVIDELPPGRKPVSTLLRYDDQRQSVYRSIGRQLAAGHQVYIVYPLITESEKLDLRSLEEGYELIRDTFPSYRVTYVHGRMKPAEKDHQMKLFAENKAQILVSTTVIEVGVNVPNASTMVIENAERFGLSQLHQLRGRVGRGAAQSYCVLMSKRRIGADTRKRLELMTRTTDGFEIAEADLRARGPGDLEGTMQSGIPIDLRIANLATDGQLVQLARDCAEQLLDADPALAAHTVLAAELRRLYPRPADLSRIS